MRYAAYLGLAGRVPGGTLRLLLVRAEQLARLLLHVAGGRLHVAGHCRSRRIRASALAQETWVTNNR